MKVLVLTTTHYPKPGAVGVSVNKIVENLRNKGHEVHLICYRNKGQTATSFINGVCIYRVKMPLFYNLNDLSNKVKNNRISKIMKKTAWFIRRFKVLLYLPFFPVTSILTIWRYYSMAATLHSKHAFELVISSYNPIEAQIASSILKKTRNNFKLVMYVLDSLSNSGGGKFFNDKFTDKMGWKWEKRLYEYADLILNMKSHEKHHQQSRYDPYRDKMDLVDIPMLVKPKSKSPRSKENKNIKKIIYTGSLNSFSRNPEYTCEVFKQLDSKSYQIDFYSQGDCEYILKSYQEETEGMISRNGYIPHDEILTKINEASFLLSIGNKNSDMIPSKIFEYIATGKPIIHFYESETDSLLPYLKKYSLALLVKQDYKLLEQNIKKVQKFIKENVDKALDFQEIEKIFEKNKPEYTVKKIINTMKN